jgi:D-serine deaminase-like pyridoxal phosphate-dependent protein
LQRDTSRPPQAILYILFIPVQTLEACVDNLLIGRPIADIETPALLLDMGAVERNIQRMADFFAGRPCELRPHTKTHKLPLIARKQVEAGAIGVTCAKLAEAKVFLEAGIRNVLIANQVIGPAKIQTLVNLAAYGDLIVCVDQIENARDIAAAAGAIGRSMSVLIEVNVGLNRCGVEPGRPALELAQQLAGLRGLRFRGLMGYEGGLYTHDLEAKRRQCAESNRLLVETKALIEAAGLPVEIATAGGSNTYDLTGVVPGITDIQPGSYATMDEHSAAYGMDFEQAVTVLTTVISRPERGRAVTDAGKKSLSVDEGLPVCRLAGVAVAKLNEEHGHLALTDGGQGLKVGDKIEIVPGHGCTTIPLYDEYVVVRDGRVESVAGILARGASW